MDNDLADRQCAPCEKGEKPLAGEAADRLLGQLSGWTLKDGKELEKEYRFPDFRQALGFVNRLGEEAEREGHHPDIYLTWGKVRVNLSTHSVGGLSENDFILAAKADRVR
ncbi:MAG TPA: 4a-hydroxytetrahydrobiopterin dehydratase [Thermoanaerobaculia bacterium]|jgi:4a-hydroxytetrahydrobiopterin dehydratase|nr:4a-hydroxytetrahydrobiopterin dehydratase [Thermoanaerobaculia bacterium]